MVGSSDEARYLPTSRQASNRNSLLFPLIFFTILFASPIAAGSVSAQVSAACAQYECAEESAACDQYGCTSDPAPGEPAPSGRSAPTGAGAPPVESELQIDSLTPAEENVDAVAPSSVYQGVPASEQYTEGYETTPSPPSEPNPIISNAEPAETEGKAASSSKSAGQSTDAEEPGNQEEDGDGDGSDENTEEPLPGYHYKGKPCEESSCGLENIEAPAECATYETASGQDVYGCSNPKTYEKKGCYEITFYTEVGNPYSNLDTCSGEKPYAPPEPPEGDFDYWAPPENRGRLDPHDFWNGVDREEDLCRNDNGNVEWHCGLDVPKTWNCGVFYGTTHGNIRGCFDQKDYLHGACYGVHLYDEVGNHLGTYPNCFERQEELCGDDQCSMASEVPDRLECSLIEHSYWGELYGSDSRIVIWCEDPVLVKRLGSGRWSDDSKTCVIIFDEDGRRIQRMPCSPQGGSHIGRKAGRDAKDADETLNGHDGPTWPAGGGSSPHTDVWESNNSGGEQAIGEQASPSRNAVNPNSSVSGGGLPLQMDVSDPSLVTLEQGAVGVSATRGSSSEDSQSAGSGLPGEKSSRGANLIPSSGGRKTWDTGNDSVDDAPYASSTHEVSRLETKRHTLQKSPGQANNDSSAPEPSGNTSFGAKGSEQNDMTRDVHWPEIILGTGKSVASFPRAAGTGGLLGTVTPLVGLGAVAGVFALRRRFLR